MAKSFGRAVLAAAAATLVLVFAPASASAAGSVSYQGDAAHSGAVLDGSLALPLTRAWSRNLGTEASYPVVADGKVFVTTANGSGSGTTLYALDESTGSTLWSRSIGGSYVFSALAYDAGTLFDENDTGVLHAFNPDDGTTRWVTQLPSQWMFTSPPSAAGGLVYTGGAGSGGTLYAVNESNGALTWSQSVMNGDHSSPAVGGGSVFVSYVGYQVYGFRASDGAAQWHASGCCEGGGGSDPVLYGGRLYTRDGGNGYVFDAATGKLIDAFGASVAPAFAGGLGYFLDNHVLTAADAASGASKWSFSGDGTLDSAPLVVNGVVYIGGSSGMVYGLDASSGAVVWSDDTGSSVPPPDEFNVAILTGLGAGDGRLLVPTSTGIVAYLGTGAPTGAGTPEGGSPSPGTPSPGSPSPGTPSPGTGPSQSATGPLGGGTAASGPGGIGAVAQPPGRSVYLLGSIAAGRVSRRGTFRLVTRLGDAGSTLRATVTRRLGHGRSAVIARASHRFASAGPAALTLRLPAGVMRLLRAGRRVSLTLHLVVSAPGFAPVTVARAFVVTLARR